MIMTDQDHNGSHIKGLLINLFHSMWPSLLKIPGFLAEFITPIVKGIVVSGIWDAYWGTPSLGAIMNLVSRKGDVKAFYTLTEYHKWKAIIPKADLSSMSVCSFRCAERL